MTVEEATEICREADKLAKRMNMRFVPDEKKLECLFSSVEIDRIWQLAELE